MQIKSLSRFFSRLLFVQSLRLKPGIWNKPSAIRARISSISLVFRPLHPSHRKASLRSISPLRLSFLLYLFPCVIVRDFQWRCAHEAVDVILLRRARVVPRIPFCRATLPVIPVIEDPVFNIRLRRILLLKLPTVVVLPLPSCLRFRLRPSLRGLEDRVVSSINDNANSKEDPPNNHDGKRNVCPVIVAGHLSGTLAGL